MLSTCSHPKQSALPVGLPLLAANINGSHKSWRIDIKEVGVHLAKIVQTLPWLQLTALKSEEAERKERAQRLAMEKAAAAGLGFGPPPSGSSLPAKVSLGIGCPYLCDSYSIL